MCVCVCVFLCYLSERPNLIYDFFFEREVFNFSPVKSDRFILRPRENNNVITIIVMTPLLIMSFKKTGNVPIM